MSDCILMIVKMYCFSNNCLGDIEYEDDSDTDLDSTGDHENSGETCFPVAMFLLLSSGHSNFV